MKKGFLKKILLIAPAVAIAGLLVFIFLPSNYHIRRALTHVLPKIDQYPIFDNRVVRAGNPRPWPLSADYGKAGIDKQYLDKFNELETIAFVVIRNDSLLFENYREGYGPDSHSNSFSMAKSIVSLMVGAAIDEGLVKGVDQPVSDFLPEFGEFNGKQLTIEHLLTMSAGVDWDESYSGLFSTTTKAYYGKDLPGQVMGIHQVEEPGVYFRYQSGVTQMLALILEKATGKTLSDYASEKIWTPIGAEHDALWSLDEKGGHEKAYCCFNSNARDFARLGQLLLNRGEWSGVQVVSAEYIDNAVTPAGWLIGEKGSGPNTNYGYQFWVLEKDGMEIPYLRGINGQVVLALKDKNSVIVRLGRKRSEVRTEQNYPDDIDTWLEAGLKIIGQ